MSKGKNVINYGKYYYSHNECMFRGVWRSFLHHIGWECQRKCTSKTTEYSIRDSVITRKGIELINLRIALIAKTASCRPK